MKYAKPPYPIYKAFFVPYLEGEEYKNCRELTEADVEDWREVLRKLKDFLQKSLEISGCRGESKLELIGDLIAIFFRAPLLREPIPGIVNPLKGYVVWRIVPEQRLKEVNLQPAQFAKSLFDLVEVGENMGIDLVLQILEEVREKVEKCWFVLPADTRPGANTSGLIPHLLTTSALAWVLAIEDGVKRRDIAIVRLAALLHDFGKPFRAQEHVRASVEVARALLDGLVEKDDLLEIIRLIEQHHQPQDPLARIISRADHLSSSVDRVHSLMRKYLFQDLQKLTGLTERELWEEIQKWEVWEEIHAKNRALGELSEKFVKKIREETENFMKFLSLPEEEYEPVREIKFGIIDLASIQETVRESFELKAVAAASFTIDVALMVHIPAFFQQKFLENTGNWLPFECFIYHGGGNTIFVFPAKYKSFIDSASEERNLTWVDEFNSYGGLKIRLVTTNFVTFFPVLLQNLVTEMSLRKLEARLNPAPIQPVSNYCKSCFLRERKEGKDWCEECSAMLEFGRDLHFKKRWSTTFKIEKEIIGSPEQIFGDWEKVEEHLMEIIAGHDLAELEEGVERRNYAVLKADGGFIGAFMGTSISLTDACERSARIDLSLKKAFEESVYELFKSLREDPEGAKKAVICAKLGLLYMGGDDTLILLNSWYAPLLALSMARKFRRHMGEMRGLSIGLVAGKSRAPVWSLIDAADELLRIAKKGIRDNPDKSSICFDVCEIPLSSTSVRYRREELEKKRITFQPFLIESQKGLLDEIFQNLSGEEEPAKWYAWAFTVSRSQGKKTEEEVRRLKRLSRAMLEALEKAEKMLGDLPSTQESAILLSGVYLFRQLGRLKSEKGEPWRLAKEFVRGEKALYGDVELLIKFVGGGMI